MKLFLIIFVFLSVIENSTAQTSLSASADKFYLDTTFVLKINPLIDDYKFRFIISILDDNEVFYTKTYLYNLFIFSSNDSLLQVITDTTDGYTFSSSKDGVEGGSIFNDINFDSYLDITLYAGSDYNGHMDFYYYWIYNTQKNVFELNDVYFENLNPNPRIDTENKIISTQYGLPETELICEDYTFKNNNLVFVERSETTHIEVEGVYYELIKVYKIINGEYKLVKEYKKELD